MSNERTAFFDPTTVAMLRNVLEDAWLACPLARPKLRARFWRNAF
jgi:hypothetical protein